MSLAAKAKGIGELGAFLLGLLLVAAIAMGGRDQQRVGQLSDAFSHSGRRPLPLLALVIALPIVSAGIMALAGAALAETLPERAASMLVAFALGLAAIELARPVILKTPAEPTRSLGAMALVLGWWQIGDAARFVIFALAAFGPYPLTAWAGGALGGMAALMIGWLAGDTIPSHDRWRLFRRALALGLMIAALYIGLNARYPG